MNAILSRNIVEAGVEAGVEVGVEVEVEVVEEISVQYPNTSEDRPSRPLHSPQPHCRKVAGRAGHCRPCPPGK